MVRKWHDWWWRTANANYEIGNWSWLNLDDEMVAWNIFNIKF